MEDKPGVFKQAALQFEVFDTELLPKRKIKPDSNFEDRPLISGQKINTFSSIEKNRYKKTQPSESLNFR